MRKGGSGQTPVAPGAGKSAVTPAGRVLWPPLPAPPVPTIPPEASAPPEPRAPPVPTDPPPPLPPAPFSSESPVPWPSRFPAVASLAVSPGSEASLLVVPWPPLPPDGAAPPAPGPPPAPKLPPRPPPPENAALELSIDDVAGDRHTKNQTT